MEMSRKLTMEVSSVDELYARHAAIVKAIRDENATWALEALYKIITRKTWLAIPRADYRRINMEDIIQDTYLSTVAAIKTPGRLNDPHRLIGLIRVIAIRRANKDRARSPVFLEDLDEWALSDNGGLIERIDFRLLVARVLRETKDLPDMYAEILRRFYVMDQEPAKIMADMGIDETRFRNAKCRALNRLAICLRLQSRYEPVKRQVWSKTRQAVAPAVEGLPAGVVPIRFGVPASGSHYIDAASRIRKQESDTAWRSSTLIVMPATGYRLVFRPQVGDYIVERAAS